MARLQCEESEMTTPIERLEVGSEVRLVVAEGEGEHGPQASTVVPVGKHHIVG